MIPREHLLAETITDPAVEPGAWLRDWGVTDPVWLDYQDEKAERAASGEPMVRALLPKEPLGFAGNARWTPPAEPTEEDK